MVISCMIVGPILAVGLEGGAWVYLWLRQEVLRAVGGTEPVFGGGTEPAIQYGGVDGAEIDGIFQIAVAVQAAQTGRLAIDALVNRLAQHEHGRRRAVIGAQTAVLLHTPPELRPGHDYYAIGLAVCVQVVIEGGQALGQRLHRGSVRRLLIGVRIEATKSHIARALAKPLHKRFRPNFRPGSERVRRIGYGRVVRRVSLAQL